MPTRKPQKGTAKRVSGSVDRALLSPGAQRESSPLSSSLSRGDSTQHVQEELGGQGPVAMPRHSISARTLGRLPSMSPREEVVLRRPSYSALEVQLLVLLHRAAATGMGEESGFSKSREDGFLEMQQVGNSGFGGKVRNFSLGSDLHGFLKATGCLWWAV